MVMEDLEETLFEEFENYSYPAEYYSPESDVEEKVPLGVVHWVSLVLYCLAFVLGIPGNAIVIWFMGFRWKKTVTTLWFLNLAIADFIFLLFLPLYISYVAMNFQWPFGLWLCKANSFIAQLNMFASVYFLTVISLDRYVHLIYPIVAHRHRTLRNSQIVIVLVWLLAAIMGGPSLYFRDTEEVNNHTICYNNFHQHDPDIALMRHHVLTWVKFIIGYLLPLLTMNICYLCLIFKVKKRSNLVSNKYFWTILAVVLAFFICWTPYHLFSIGELTIHHSSYFHQVLRAGIPLSTALAFLNSCLNPILYVLISKKFQARFRASVAEILKYTLWEVSCSGTVGEQLRNSETKNSCLLETAQ
ncbi:chemerin-like receptor 2 [Desmodus rotundus]|uniref:chemerin-like receptor 2 n=1 Tax=Desmodus rotundus TaxID=9430 RepID=UPI000D181120|nr:chemerin-like receptor 2 [Desmodus rotundus]XP_045054443.1 chemerin-like receptor 2 [Desmodus rotundus]XP_045054445.1 chemerin-like receptor 2 [Desmodus rotundus]XP_045054446.1 chemerin-like receptor 2 [Desmodus rotundus]XP_045054447.1 chemerin-like receptor 2 [Desmodus rotundus]XP_045054448.1 chemerin-like receptor 2 [Desmodus rotundus]XP_053774970.1 chemerin-like receptor 2 [Desmodus rotundus]